MENREVSVNNDSLSEAFSKELLSPSIDLATDYSEIFIDDLFNDGILKEIPFVKTAVGAIRTIDSITKWYNAKKLLIFIQEFNSSNIDPLKMKKFKSKFETDRKFRQKTIEQVIVFNDRFLELNKANICAQLFISYIEEKITWDEFRKLNTHLDFLRIESFSFMENLESTNYEVSQDKGGDKKFEEQAMLQSSGIARETSAWSHGFIVNAEGIKLYELGIKPFRKKNTE